ncbi:Exoenzymes regulatory protein AepA-like [Oopsacas minuta]|uniref:Exoenzymes regulatory protein AepA-like n=1 Tax=Oopsacas minuta TaxID=111878 RepID=A0AAV7K2N8_9METZ|nr:Exoenzymes regulatory protein AepA-like [Oopsacas minuta]
MAGELVRADKILFGGNIFTLEESYPSVEAVAVTGSKISALGKLSDVMQYVGESTEVIFLNNKSLFPGFIEAHQHAILRAVLSSKCIDIGAYHFKSADDIIHRISSEVNKAITITENSLVPVCCIFYGWDAELFPNLPKLSADYINSNFSALIPIIISTQSFHCSWVNHRVFELIDPEICKVKGDKYSGKTGDHFTGQIIDGNIKLIFNVLSLSEDEQRDALWSTWLDYSFRGFTTVTELAYIPNENTDRLIKQIAMREDCPIRIALYQGIMGEERDEEIHKLDSPNPDKLWIAGVKLWADGSPHTGTVATREPLLHTSLAEPLSFPPPPNYGVLKYETSLLRDKIEHYHRLGVQIAVHTQGERAIEQVLRIYETLTSGNSIDSRHRLEHLGLATEQQLTRCGKIGVALSLFVYHLYYYGRTLSEYILGRERTNRWAPLASAIKYNRYISIHQDSPAISGPPLPLINMQTAVTRCEKGKEHVFGQDQCISVHEAIKAYTIGPAWQLFMEEKIGSLRVGKFADFVILSENPYLKSPRDLEHIKIVETYCGGRCNKNSNVTVLNIHKFSILGHLK